MTIASENREQAKSFEKEARLFDAGKVRLPTLMELTIMSCLKSFGEPTTVGDLGYRLTVGTHEHWDATKLHGPCRKLGAMGLIEASEIERPAGFKGRQVIRALSLTKKGSEVLELSFPFMEKLKEKTKTITVEKIEEVEEAATPPSKQVARRGAAQVEQPQA